MSTRANRGRRMLGRIRRGRLEGFSGRDDDRAGARQGRPAPDRAAPSNAESRGGFGSGWDHTERPIAPPPSPTGTNLRARLLSLFADPRVQWVTLESAARTLDAPKADVEAVVTALVQSGELIERGDTSRRFRVPHAEKQRLESMFREAALELGEHGVLAPVEPEDDALALYDDDPEEPRLPVTAGLLSLFLPGTGQLLNGDVGRASLVFAVWSLAWITHLSPVWTFVCLYAGAEAFFTAKIRSMERKMAKDALPAGTSPAGALPPPKPHRS
ncbi:MAG: hypothetical protein ACE37F_34595 [Nannocystaceae bacterium]|nr:hypothetical protein [bacterium]